MDQSKRTLLKGGASAMALGFLGGQAPAIIASPKVVLRVLGTHVTLQEELRQQAMQELGFEISFEPRGSSAVLQKASMFPESFDLYEQWSNSIRILWDSQSIQPIDKTRITRWNEINSLTKTGRLTPNAPIGAGDAPYSLLHIQDDGSLGYHHSDQISFLPYVHNVDSFGYNSAIIPRGSAYQTESWGWLLEDRYRGKVGLVNAPTIGIFDVALAAQAKGFIQFADIGNISKDELDKLFSILLEFKKQGYFSGFWNSVPESVDFMREQRVHIQSMFSPGVSALNGEGIPCIYAAPKEGYRGWHGVMCLSSACEGAAQEAAYAYMNWWLSGWPGAFIARQGYYISNPQTSMNYLSQDEINYWYKGLETTQDLKGTDGRISIHAGQRRNGGSYEKRFSHVAVWNTVMPSYDYTLQKWYEFISS